MSHDVFPLQTAVALLQHVDFSTDVHTSGVLFVYWTLQVTCGAFSLASRVIEREDVSTVRVWVRVCVRCACVRCACVRCGCLRFGCMCVRCACV